MGKGDCLRAVDEVFLDKKKKNTASLARILTPPHFYTVQDEGTD